MFVILIFGGDFSEVFICQNFSSCELSMSVMYYVNYSLVKLLKKFRKVTHMKASTMLPERWQSHNAWN